MEIAIIVVLIASVAGYAAGEAHVRASRRAADRPVPADRTRRRERA